MLFLKLLLITKESIDMSFSRLVKLKFLQILEEINSHRSDFVKEPSKNFTRKRKISFSDIMKWIINLHSGNLEQEILHFYRFASNHPTKSAFIQQRAKIKLEAFFAILFQLNQAFPSKKYRGYSLLACDGSDVSLPLAKNTEGNQEYTCRKRKESRDYYQIHLHALYDICSQRYKNIRMEPRKKANEKNALKVMIKEGKEKGEFEPNTIFLLDRGYEAYDPLFLIDSIGCKFLCRAKDGKDGGIVKGFHLPQEGEVDVTFHRIFSRSNAKKVKESPQIYHRVYSQKDSVILGKERLEYEMSFRIVRVKLGNDYECLLTNLSEEEFSMEELKQLYWKRWGIETSFRHLKYAVRLVDFHSKKIEFIEQEILARVILYNFSQIIIKEMYIPKRSTQYTYQVNTTLAIYICHRFLDSDEFCVDVEALLQKEILPIRLDRRYERNLKKHSAVGFGYRTM